MLQTMRGEGPEPHSSDAISVEAAASAEERLLLRHCLGSSAYFAHGFSHRMSSPLGALMTNLSMLRDDLTDLRKVTAEGAAPTRASELLTRLLEDIESASNIADKMRTDLLATKRFASASVEEATVDLRELLGIWSRTIASAIVQAGVLRVHLPVLGAELKRDETGAWLVAGSLPALSHLLTTALSLVVQGRGWIEGQAQVEIVTTLCESGVELVMVASGADLTTLSRDAWHKQIQTLAPSALAEMNEGNASLELLCKSEGLVARLNFRRAEAVG